MKKVIVDEQKIDELLSRSVEEVIPGKAQLRELLLSGNRLRIYIGTDATGSSLHLGHATNYIILEKFRELGHEVIFLVGDFTSRIGDPTDKGISARKQLTRDEVVENTSTWLKQVRPIINLDDQDNPVKILYNHDWLSKLTFEDVVNLASNFTVQQMLERDMFQKRIAEGSPLFLHELFYPLMQGYDSVAMDVDIEMCGMDQKFNALAGRTLQRKLKDREKFVFITTLLENPKTKEKMMSKSLGTGVFLDASANDMYGGVMAQPDENMHQLFVDCTKIPLAEIDGILASQNPRDAKMQLAKEIVCMYHGEAEANAAEAAFIATFQEKGVPEDVLVLEVSDTGAIADALVKAEIVASKSELTRLLQAGGVRHAESGEKIAAVSDLKKGESILKVGKRRFVKIILG